ncbi:MAG: DNA repair protein RecO [Alcaligenaceae bacterium]|nr:DNA repair protein RecO [Alcaligenaceae bacterium]
MSKRVIRVTNSLAYLLHAVPWRETSLLIQVFSRDHGIVAMVAKGAKRPYSSLRSVLAGFQPLHLSWSGGGDVKTLTRADNAGLRPLSGRTLMSAWYMNELLLSLLPREDPHPALFEAYDAALIQLAAGSAAASALRRFEWILLHETGYGLEGAPPDFDDPVSEPELRRSLRERIDSLLVGRPLRTRAVLMALQRL